MSIGVVVFVATHATSYVFDPDLDDVHHPKNAPPCGVTFTAIALHRGVGFHNLFMRHRKSLFHFAEDRVPVSGQVS